MTAIEEEGDVGILLGLRRAQLCLARIADHFADEIAHRLRCEGNRERKRVVVTRHGDDVHRRTWPGVEAGKVCVGERVQRLAHPVRPEVEEDHRVAILHRGHRLIVVVHHRGWQELVGDAAGVIRLAASPARWSARAPPR